MKSNIKKEKWFYNINYKTINRSLMMTIIIVLIITGTQKLYADNYQFINLGAISSSRMVLSDGTESTSGVDNTIGTIVTKQEPIMITGRNGSNSIEWSNVMLAGEKFVYIPYRNDSQTVRIYALSTNAEAANVTSYKNGSTNQTWSITPGSFETWAFQGINQNIEIISDQPILVYHYSNSADSTPIPPASNTIYGSVSSVSHLGAIGNDTVIVDYYCTDNSSGTINAGSNHTDVSGEGQYTGKSCKYVARNNELIGAISIADGDGVNALPRLYLVHYFQQSFP